MFRGGDKNYGNGIVSKKKHSLLRMVGAATNWFVELVSQYSYKHRVETVYRMHGNGGPRINVHHDSTLLGSPVLTHTG